LSNDPKTKGFDVNIGGNHSGNPGSYYPPYKRVPSLIPPSDDYYLTNLIMDKVLDFVEKVEGEPFFLYYSPYAVHTPIQPVKSLLNKYQSKPEWNGQNNAKYATMIENLDIQVGRLIDKLKESGQIDNTFILFTSDNGGPLDHTNQRPLRAGKGSYHEGGIRVPMFAYWKGKIASGVTSEAVVSNLDFFPTILEIAGVQKPMNKVLDGMSILPVFTENKKMDRPIYWHFPIYLQSSKQNHPVSIDRFFRTRPGSAIRYGDWKLIQYFENNDIHLYNLKDDVNEQYNLVDSNPQKAEELLNMLDEWRRSTNAPVPTELNPEYVKQ
ncbi:sulfatase-like hydrolase/transferase, partial [Carboxylicivirga marina]|uniref:sulfatase-like hydrolase/transferase n=1 Tax=Carboxylicivirga marina TaxID=2800988 RepID=UPI002599F9DF